MQSPGYAPAMLGPWAALWRIMRLALLLAFLGWAVYFAATHASGGLHSC